MPCWTLVPLEVWTLIASRLRVRDMVALRTVFLRHLTPDALFREVAHHRWGRAFWRRARTRLTRAVFRSYLHELARMQLLEDRLALMGLPPWTASDYELWWACEAKYLCARATNAA